LCRDTQKSQSIPYRCVRVHLGSRSYDIEIATGILAQLGSRLKSLRDVTHSVLITDTNVIDHARRISDSFAREKIRSSILTVPPGEASKSVEQVARLWNELLAAGADRKSVVVAVGGGVVGDLAGFAAASFARGLDFVQVPTTLLAQVDSSVGGKVGINLPGGKNMVGHFWQPIHVTIDPEVLCTLPLPEYTCGLAEVVKYGVILDEEFFRFLEANVDSILARNGTTLEHLILRCCQLKASVVEDDERETKGLRSVLNYGHTFAHALEAVSGYGQLLHGEAVAIGMLCASRLAESLGRVDSVVTQRQLTLLERLGLPVEVPELDTAALLRAMASDKKVEHGRLRFVLPSRIGHVDIVDGVAPDLVLAALTPSRGS
jgi:3-dehydroquinate synthase